MIYDLDLLVDYYEDVTSFKKLEYERILKDLFSGNINIKDSKFEIWTKFLIESTDFEEIKIYIINMGLNK